MKDFIKKLENVIHDMSGTKILREITNGTTQYLYRFPNNFIYLFTDINF